MKWFKHYSDNYRGRSVTSFHRHFGHTGVAWYFLLTEICSEKLEKNKNRDINKDDCIFTFDKAFIESSLRGTFAKIERWLGHGVAMGLWTFTTTEFELSVNYPILLELLDSDHIKTRLRRDSDAACSPPDKDKDKDKDIYTAKYDFESAFKKYPYRKNANKTRGIKKLQSLIKTDLDFQQLILAIENYSQYCNESNISGQYVKQFSTFVGEWRDWVEPVSSKSYRPDKNGVVPDWV